ncbi:MAG TPA: coenzyme F430 synthase, partial [Methanotrichaceae archaeon]|nr:coenzyme F430 synthase [Methanotrichaceae archaeon]
LLSKMLSARRLVVSHTTRGIDLWSGGSSRLLRQGLSITPGNAIPAMEEAVSRGADALVLETSLGGTGIADFGVLTSFSGDYMIAGGTKWASTAKLQMVSLAKKGFRLVANTDVKISPDVSFGTNGQVRAEPDRIHFGEIGHNSHSGHNNHNDHNSYSIRLSEDLDFPSYQTALAAAAATAHAAGIVADGIVSSLEGFDGFGGRMKIDRKEGLTVYDCSNSGLKLSDVKRALDNASGGSLGMVVGEEAETVCEGMDVPGLVELLRIRRKEIGHLVLVGKRLEPWAKELEAKTARDLTAGRETAIDQGVDRLLLCVKCFR